MSESNWPLVRPNQPESVMDLTQQLDAGTATIILSPSE